jgi:hypothetical protein
MSKLLLTRILYDELPASTSLESLITVIHQGRPREWLSDYPNTQDLHELLALKEVHARSIVWQDEKKKVKAFCVTDPYNNLIFECTEDSNYPELFHEAVQFSQTIIRKNNLDSKEFPSLDASCRGDDFRRIHCLESEGFSRDIFESVSFIRSLSDHMLSLKIPDGFIIRPLAGE